MFFLTKFRKKSSTRSKSVPNKPQTDHQKADSLLLALEPRYLYDAAGVVSGLDIANDHDVPAPAVVEHIAVEAHPVFDLDDITVPADFAAPVNVPQELVFVDTSVTNYQQLIENISPNAATIIIDSSEDGIVRMSNELSNYSDVQAVHILSHGTEGQINIGNASLNAKTIGQYSQLFKEWDNSLTQDADILIYGCNVAADTEGVDFITDLADLTKADVAASSDDTGSRELGGDWDLEAKSGSIEEHNALPMAMNYDGLLAAPVLGGASTTLTYTENSGAQAIDNTVTVTDSDSSVLSASVTITGSYIIGEDLLQFTNTGNITGSWDALNGTMTLNGSDSAANYQAALRNVQYENLSDNPNTANRFVRFLASDGTNSNAVFSQISITPVNDLPTINAGAALNFTEGDSATVLDNTITVADADHTSLASAQVVISGNYQAEDVLTFSNQSGITGTWIAGTLDLTGAATLAEYQTALRSITYSNTGGDIPVSGARTISWTVNDGSGNSTTSTSSVTVSAVDDAPSATNMNAAQTVNEDITLDLTNIVISDVDSANVTATLTLSDPAAGAFSTATSGAVTSTYNAVSGAWQATGALANVNILLAGVQYVPTGDYDTGFTIATQVTDGTSTLNDSKTITITPINDAPTISSGATLSFNENDAPTAIDAAVSIADVDNSTIQAATVIISAGFQAEDSLAFSTQNGISATWTAGTQTLALTGSATVADYQTALQSITYINSAGDNPTAGSRTLTWTINDGALTSATANSTVTVTASNDAPTATNLTSTATYTEGDASVAITDIVVSDADTGDIVTATLTLANTSTGALTAASGNGETYTSGTGVWTITGTTTVVNAALANMAYVPTTNNDLDTSISVNIADGGENGATALTGTVTLDVTPVNDAPTSASNTITTNEDTAYAFASGDFSFNDVDTGATLTNVKITALPAAGILKLSGVNVTTNQLITVADITAGNLSFSPATNANGAGYSSFTFQVEDGSLLSGNNTMTINVNAVNDAPALTAGNTLAYSEGDGVKTIDNTVTVSDVDTGATITGAKVTITGGFAAGQDVLNFANNFSVSLVSYNALTGVLTLTGTTTMANYESALRTVTYENTNTNNPIAGSRTISWLATDNSSAVSSAVSSTINVSAVNDLPVLAAPSGNLAYSENATAAAIDAAITVNDVDDVNIESATITISGNHDINDLLSYDNSATPAISVAYNSTNGILTLSGADTTANYQTALRNVKFSNSSDNPSTLQRTISWVVNDGDGNSNTTASLIDVTALNDVPTAANKNIAMSEDATYTLTASDFGFSDVDSGDTLTQIRISQLESAGALQLSGANVIQNQIITVADINAGNLKYFPNSDGFGVAYDNFRFEVHDGTIYSATDYAMTFDVSNIQDLPTATNNAISINEDSVLTFSTNNFNFSDVDGDLLNKVQISTLPGAGTLELNGVAVTVAQEISSVDISNNLLTFTPVANANGAAYASFTFKVHDGTAFSAAAYTMTVNVNAVNDAPQVTINGIPQTFTEGGAAVTVDNAVAITDIESNQINSATITITTGFAAGQDNLNFTPVGSITGSFNALSGILTLSGTDSIANYQSTLQSVTYNNINLSNPLSGARTVEFVVNDGSASNIGSITINVTAVNDAPVLSAGGTLSYTENSAAANIDNLITVTDVDDINLTGATVSINPADYENGKDVLAFAGLGSITGSWDSATGTLTLTGTDTVTNYQSALRAVTYQNLSDNPTSGSRQIDWLVNDGSNNSTTVNSTVNVTVVNDAPTISNLTTSVTYLENTIQATPAILDTIISFADADSADLNSGNLTISNLNINDVISVNNQSAVDGNIQLSTANVQYHTGGSWQTIGTLAGGSSGSNLIITFSTAVATPTAVDALLQNITYQNTSDNPPASHDLNLTVNDGDGGTSAIQTIQVNITAQNENPTISGLGNPTFLENSINTTPAVIDSAVVFADPDSTDLNSGQLTISNLDVSDTLSVNSQAAVDGNIQLSGSSVQYHTGGSWQTIGTLTGGVSGTDLVITFSTSFATPTAVDALIQNINFLNNSDAPPAAHNLSLSITDGDGGSLTPQTITINITPENDAPTLDLNGPSAGIDFSTTYNEGTPVKVFDVSATALDPDNTNLSSITVTLTNRPDGDGVESLVADVTSTSLTATYTQATGVLLISGADTVANYQQVLRTVTYDNTSNTPDLTNRSITAIANDGTANSILATSTLSISATNDPPTATNNTITTNEDTAHTFIAADFNYSDVDADPLAKVQVTALESNGVLEYFNGSSWLAVNLNQEISKADIDAGNLRFIPATNANGASYDTFSFKVNDGTAYSAAAYNMTVDVTAINDLPTAANSSISGSEDNSVVFNAANFAFNDVDADPMSSVQITTLETVGTLQYNSGSWVNVTLNQVISKADIDAGKLRFTPVANAAGNPYDNFSFTVNDGTADSAAAYNMTVNITPVGDTPQVTNITTLEDNQSGAIILSRNVADGAEVTHFRISNITGGSLYQSDGATAINSGDYITFAQGTAGLKFTPAANSNSNGSFGVESSEGGTTVAAQSGVATSTITVTPVGDSPQVSNITTLEDTQSGAIVLDKNSLDGAEVTSLRISNINGGTLYQNDGTTVINNGNFISLAQGNAGLKFTPNANSNANGSFDVESSEDGSTVAAQSSAITSTITVTPVGDTPQVTSITTLEDTQSGAIVVTPNVSDGAEVTHFRISSIVGGTLYQNDGTTVISNGAYITTAQGVAGLKFTPTANSNTNGSFDVESSQNGTSVATQSGVVTSTISITPVGDTPQVTNITTLEDTQSGAIVVAPNTADGAEVTNFRISAISNGTLYLNDGSTVINNGDYITVAQGAAGLKFTPATNSNVNGSFNVQSSEDGTTIAAQSGIATSTITITPVGDTPQITSITTAEDTQSGDIFVTPNAADGAEVSHFKISNISGGLVYQNNGTTLINAGDYITAAQGAAGLKFSPTANSITNGSFDVEASENGTTVATQSGTATSTITITPVGDTPQVNNITTLEDNQSGGIVLSRNAVDGVEVNHFQISNILNGILYQNDGITQINNSDVITYAQGNTGLKFTPSANSNINGSFDVKSATSAAGAGLSTSAATSTITVTPVGDTPQVTSITTLEDTQSGAIIITPHAADGAEVTDFRISAISNGILYQNDGTTVINNGDYITLAEGATGLKFTPTVNSNTNGTFAVEASEDGTSVAVQSGAATSTITVTPVGDTPQVTNITTLEDSQSGAIILARNAADGTEVSHFRISAITNGTLYQNDGTTIINSGDHITFAQGAAGLKFTPTANSNANGTFNVEASEDGVTVAAQSGTATSTITVTPVGDTPQVTNITTLEDNQSGNIVLTPNAADGAEVTNFRISNITGGSLFQNNGSTVINNGDYITVVEGAAGLKFTPTANSNASGTFAVESSEDGSTVAAQSGIATSTITVTPVGDTPQVASIITQEDTQSAAIILARNAADGAEVSHFRISAITNGNLYQSDGSTVINSGDYITFAQGTAGLKFTPTANSNASGSFAVEASEDGTTVAAQSGIATSTITVTPVGDTPIANSITTLEDTQSAAIVLDRNAVDGVEVSHFQVSNILNGNLYQNDGTTQINNGDIITYAQGNSGLIFTPSTNSNISGTFEVRSATSAAGAGLSSTAATSTITITPVGDTPQVTNISTLEDIQSGNIIVTPNAADGAEVTNFHISNITDGTLYQNDGSTVINNGNYITLAEGAAGLKFTPTANSNTNGTFDVESSEDGSTVAAQSGTTTSTITIIPVNDAPTATNMSAAESFTEDAISFVFNAITITDIDSANVTATLTLSDPNAGALATNTSGAVTSTFISGVWTASGALADVNILLSGLTFTPALDYDQNFTIATSVDDGNDPAITGSKSITVTPVQDVPTSADNAANIVQNLPYVFLSSDFPFADVDTTGANTLTQIQITSLPAASAGVLTLSGTAVNTNDIVTLAQINSNSLVFTPVTDFIGSPTFNFSVYDGLGYSSPVNAMTVNITNANAPVLTAGSILNYTENDPASGIDPGIFVADNSDEIIQATVTISAGFNVGEDVLAFTDTAQITGFWNGAGGILTLTSVSGTATLAEYQTALRSITYENLLDNPTAGNRTISWVATDNDAAGPYPSIPVTSTVAVSAVNDAPIITAGSTLNYAENDPASAIDPAINITDLDSPNLNSASIKISSGYINGQDVLGFTNTGSLTGSWDAATATMTMSGVDTVVNYRNALRSVTYINSEGANPFAGNRTISFQVNDGADNSIVANSIVTVSAVNDAPTITAGGTAGYTEGDPATAIDGTITIADVDNSTMQSATVRITGGYTISEDLLAFNDTANITSSWDGAGTLTLSGTDTLTAYRDALRNVTYTNINTLNPVAGNRTISFEVNDGINASIAALSTMTVTSVNDLPVVSSGAAITFTEGDSAVIIDSNLSLSDNDNSTFSGATISIGSGYVNGEDVLAFTDTASITGTWTAATGTLSLNGIDTIAAYETALRSITFDNTVAPPSNPTIGNRTIFFVVTDGIDPSIAANSAITVAAVDDAPTATNLNTGESFTEDGAAFSLNNIVVTDPDSTNVTATLTISDINAGSLSSNDGATYNSGSGIWTISNTIANVNTALANVQLTPAANYDQNFFITTQINDATSSIAGSKTVTVTPQDDAPTLAANTGLTLNEGGTTTITQTMLDYIDVDTGDTLTYTVGTVPTNGSLFKNGTALNATDTFTQTDINSGLITYTHSGSETTTDSLIFDLDDSTAPSPDFSNVTFNINVNPVNDAPTSANSTVTTNEDTTLTFAQADFTYNDAEANAFSKIKITQLPTQGTFQLSGVDVGLNQEVTVGNLTNLAFTPAANANGTAYESFRYMVHDGTVYSSTDYTMTIDVNAVNDAPLLDNTPSPALSVIQRNSSNAIGDTVGDIIINGSISDVDGTAIEAIAVTSVDNSNGFWQYSTNGGSTWNNFSATSGSTVNLEGALASRLLQATDKIRFKPNSSWDGNATFTFRAWDMSTGSGTAGGITNTTTNGGTSGYSSAIDSATIKINANPVANSDTAITGQNQPVILPLTGNDTDNSGDPLTIASFTTPTHGKVVDNGNGTLTYTPNFTYFGPDNFSYTISDGFGGTSSSTVNIEVIESIGPQAMPAVTSTQPVPDIEFEPLETLDGLVATQDSMLLDLTGKIEAGMSDGTEYIGSTMERQNFEEFIRPAASGDAEQFARKFGSTPQNDIIRQQAVNQAQPIAQPADAASIKIGELAEKTDLLKQPKIATEGAANEPAPKQPLPIKEVKVAEETLQAEEKSKEAIKEPTQAPQPGATHPEQQPTANLNADQQNKQPMKTDARTEKIPPAEAEPAVIRQTMDEAFKLLQCD